MNDKIKIQQMKERINKRIRDYIIVGDLTTSEQTTLTGEEIEKILNDLYGEDHEILRRYINGEWIGSNEYN